MNASNTVNRVKILKVDQDNALKYCQQNTVSRAKRFPAEYG